jgi:predicted metal-dependent TIM-barrel fold hydrolase
VEEKRAKKRNEEMREIIAARSWGGMVSDITALARTTWRLKRQKKKKKKIRNAWTS